MWGLILTLVCVCATPHLSSGGGRIKCSHAGRRVHIYGYSVGFGGGEGGPPGRGMRDHAEVAALVQERYAGYAVTFAPDGY